MHQYLFLLLTKLAFSRRRALDAPAISKVVRGGGHAVLILRGAGLILRHAGLILRHAGLILRYAGGLVLQDATERFDCSDALWSSLLACLDAGGVTDKDEKE